MTESYAMITGEFRGVHTLQPLRIKISFLPDGVQAKHIVTDTKIVGPDRNTAVERLLDVLANAVKQEAKTRKERKYLYALKQYIEVA